YPEPDTDVGLPVELLRVRGRKEDRLIRADHRRRVLREQRGELRDLRRRELRSGLPAGLLTFLEVLAVVPSHAEHVPWRPRDRRVELRAGQGDTASRLARRAAKVVQEFLAGEQQVEHVVLVGGPAHEVDRRKDGVVGRDDTGRRDTTVLERAEPHVVPTIARLTSAAR